MASEFKEFALKGNVVDMAIGVIVGGAFGKIVSSLVSDVIMPPIGKLIGGVSFANLHASLGMGSDGKEVLLNYGTFLQTIIDFAIIAFVLFMAIRAMNKLKKAPPPVAAVPPPPPRSEVLLEEIRNLLAKR
jgi:large conductance mechanosensitive channel